jgi:lysyl endopeptidase
LSIGRRFGVAVSAIATLLCAWPAAAATVERLNLDLKPLILKAADSPAQFAVPVPHRVSAASAGHWSSAHGVATWSYAVSVPGAVSLSFHAARAALPAGATLVVEGERTTTGYGAADIHLGQLWSRVQPGAALQFTLSVPAAARAQVLFEITSLQVGYRSLGPGASDHPYYRELREKKATTASGNSSCVVNYECKVAPGNAAPAAATVALLVANQFQCTGTLINDVPGDNTPYVLSARHCITGQVDVADDPMAAAEATTVYWDATSACGATLGSIYDPSIPMQAGAQTMVEQQDAWLIRLDVNPVVSDAQFAGFDASGGAVTGGYTVHHAEGFDKQFTAWFGQAAKSSLVAGFAPFLETVNQTGNIGSGASGSAFYDSNNRLVGSLTYGRDTNDATGYQSCPVASPQAPNGSNGVADFTALAAVWTSVSDTTSATGTTTIKSVLDPQNTGTLTVPSAPAAAVSLGASAGAQVYGQPLTLTWSASGASQCTPGGGLAGDGWSGSQAAAGSLTLTEGTSAASLTYTLVCSYAGNRTARASVTVIWEGPAPVVTLNATPAAVWTTRPVTLSWTSNVTPCALAGGTLALTGLASSGSTTTTATAAGDVTYTLTCGSASNPGVTATLVQYADPNVIFEANGTDRLVGETFLLQWQSFADTCVALGGAPGDGWAGNTFSGGSTLGSFAPYVTGAGTYTYTLSCTSGTLSLQQNLTVTFENNAPYVTASLSANSVAYSNSPADYLTLSWNSNLSSCTTVANPALVTYMTNDPLGANNAAQGSQTLGPQQSGSYTLTVTCTSQNQQTSVSSTPLTLTVTPPAPPTASLTLNPTAVVAGETFTVSWTSTGAAYCSRAGGLPGDSWATASAPAAGSASEVAAAGAFTFGLTCYSIDPATAPVSLATPLTIGTLDETLSSNLTSVTTGGAFTLSWSAPGATQCTASGGGANGAPWEGALDDSGTVTQTATTPGTFEYTLTCGINNDEVTQAVTIKVVTATNASSGAGGGGGGDLGLLELVALGTLLARRRRRGTHPQGPAGPSRRPEG